MTRQEIVFFDLETGGLEARPSIIRREQWEALEEYGRGPKPMFPVDMGSMDLPVSDTRKGEADCEWCYCPGNPITQIGAAACDFDTLEEIAEFEVKMIFRPELTTPEALGLNSYDPDIWGRDAELCPIGLGHFARFLEAHRTMEMTSKRGFSYKVARLAGHNAASFDLEFLLRSFADSRWQRYALPGDAPRSGPVRNLFFPGSFQVLDTLHLARWAYRNAAIENLKLETLAREAGYHLPGAHDALADVRANIEIARFLLAKTRL